METQLEGAAKPRSQRGWKIAFFICLFAFEVARESAVISASEPVKTATLSSVTKFGDYIRAEGRWVRMDGGSDRLVPNITVIECNRADGTCQDTDVSAYDGYVSTPTTSKYSAKFTADSVSYSDDMSVCAVTYRRIDLQLNKAFQVRELKPGVKDQECAGMESRIESQLADGNQQSDYSIAGHFVPVFWLLRVLSGQNI